MPDFVKEFPVGTHVWHCISQGKGAWRCGHVVESTAKDGHYGSYGKLTIHSPGTRQNTELNGYHSSRLLYRGVIPVVPQGTIYIVDTKMGDMLSYRLPGDAHFEVFECGTRAMTKGNLLGYVIIPGQVYQANMWHKLPLYQTWMVGPNVYELLSFLGAKLPEITNLHHGLKAAYAKENPGSDD